jgi:hypothetical protein
MNEDPLHYDVWIEDALRGVVRRTLAYTATKGLPGDHHYYVTFRTGADGVQIPKYLKALHPEEMTVVLQHQFDNLAAHDDRFEVTLRFKGKAEHLIVPYAAMTAFADPSVNLGFQFKAAVEPSAKIATSAATSAPADKGGHPVPVADAGSNRVVALDSFRKK